MADFLIADGDFEGERCHQVGPVDDVVLRGILKLGEGGADVHLDLLCGTDADLEVVGAAHVVEDVLGEVVAGNLDALVGDDASEGYYGDFGGAAAYVDNHVAFGGLDVKADAEGGGHGLVNHVDVASVGMFGGVADGTDFHFGGAGGDAYDHPEGGGEPVALGAGLLHEAADHELGGVEVGDYALAEWTHRADAGVALSFHQVGFLSDGDKLFGAGIEGHDRGFVDYDFIIVDDNRVCRAQVHGDFFRKGEESHWIFRGGVGGLLMERCLYRLVAEVTEAGEDHSHSVSLAVVDALGVADGAAGLDNILDACAVGYFNAVGEGEESVGSHCGALEVETEALGLSDSLFECIHAGGLAYAGGEELTVLGEDDGVALGVLYDLVGEKHVGHGFVGEISAADEL